MAIVCVGLDLAKNVRPGPRNAGYYDARPDPFHAASSDRRERAPISSNAGSLSGALPNAL